MPGVIALHTAHDCDDLIVLFNQLFAAQYRTILEKGGDEPLYRPADADGACHRVIFRQDYFASALHEVAHWCIAGSQRRRQADYGYWYRPDGRNSRQQRHFERVEARPQALEWIFSQAARYKFSVSNDNLAAGVASTRGFEQAIHGQVQRYCRQGLPRRAARFRLALARFYATPQQINVAQFLPCE